MAWASDQLVCDLSFMLMVVCVYIAILFTAMLRHGLIPDALQCMIPIPKGWWANLSSSDKCISGN